MSQEQSHDKVCAIIRNILIDEFGATPDEIREGRLTRIITDSLDRLELVMKCEEIFGMSITVDAPVFNTQYTVDDLAELCVHQP